MDSKRLSKAIEGVAGKEVAPLIGLAIIAFEMAINEKLKKG